MDADLTLKIVQNYLEVLEEHPSQLVDISHLPSSKETLKRSIQTLWYTLEKPEERDFLKTPFLCLANFQAGISPAFERLFFTSQLEVASSGESIETRFRKLAQEKFPDEFECFMNLREGEIDALAKEITSWEKDEFE